VFEQKVQTMTLPSQIMCPCCQVRALPPVGAVEVAMTLVAKAVVSIWLLLPPR